MRLEIFDDAPAAGCAAAAVAARVIAEAVEARGRARVTAATGASQLIFLDALAPEGNVPWGRVELFHLDEYIGLPITHAASFRKYLLDRLIRRTGIRTYHLLDGEADPEFVCEVVGRALTSAPIDVAFVGIGENGHLAFNDPPADFDTERPFLIVNLDDASRRQQVGEGWFATLDDVPRRAISMSIRQILESRRILCMVDGTRKAAAVKACLTGPVSSTAPASILCTHPDTTVFADMEAAGLLEPEAIAHGRALAARRLSTL